MTILRLLLHFTNEKTKLAEASVTSVAQNSVLRFLFE